MTQSQIRPALTALREGWWMLLVRGIAAVLFGLTALFWPGLTAYALLITFGAFALVDGVFSIVAGIRRKGSDDRWWVWLVEGALSLAIGVMAFVWPIATALAFVIWIAAWAVVAGVLRIIAAIRLRHEIEGEWALGLSGVLLIIWGGLLAMMPAAGILGLTWLFGGFSLAIGAVLIMLAFRVRKLPDLADWDGELTD